MTSKLDQAIIDKIYSYDKDKSNVEIWKELWIPRQTVRRYRKNLADNLSATEDRKLSKEEKKKLDLVQTYSEKELKDLLYQLQIHTSKDVEDTIGEPWHLKFALLWDTHFGNKMSAKKELADFYKKAWERGVETFIHCWDLVDGDGVYPWQQYEQDKIWYGEQLQDVVDNYPYYWNLKTYVVWWNHDESFLKRTWANIVQWVSNLRDDIINMWFYDARIKLNWVDINAHHGGGSMSYAKSYKPQKLIENIPVDNQPDIFASGHWHDALYMAYRNIHTFLPWAFLKQNLLAKRYNLWNTIWWWIVDIDINEKGESRIDMEFIQY